MITNDEYKASKIHLDWANAKPTDNTSGSQYTIQIDWWDGSNDCFRIHFYLVYKHP